MRNRGFKKFEVKEIKHRWAKAQKRKIKDANALRRLQVLHLRVKGKTNAEISEIVGFSKQYIIEVVAKYRNKGMDAILEDKRTGNNRKLSFDEEAAFLDQFYDLAEAGQLVIHDCFSIPCHVRLKRSKICVSPQPSVPRFSKTNQYYLPSGAWCIKRKRAIVELTEYLPLDKLSGTMVPYTSKPRKESVRIAAGCFEFIKHMAPSLFQFHIKKFSPHPQGTRLDYEPS